MRRRAGEHLFQRYPVLFIGGAIGGLGFSLAGRVCLWRKWRSIALVFLIGLTLGLGLSYLRSTLWEDPDIFLFQWYFIYLLPPLCGLASIGIVALAIWLGSRIGKVRPARRLQRRSYAL